MVKIKINSEIISDIEVMIFDKDGTLIDLYHYWSSMVSMRVDISQRKIGFDKKHKAAIMYAMGVDTANRRLRSEGPVGLKKREIVMQAMIDILGALGYNNTYEACHEAFKDADTSSLRYLSKIIKPINGMHELIDNLFSKGCKIAIATTDKSERAKLAMKYLGIDEKIFFVAGEDMVEHCKPAPDMVNMILKKAGIFRENAVMSGDAITDVEMGINAGLKASIGVCSGLTSMEELTKKTRFVIKDISQIEIV